jgi:hypothetical protein
MSLERARFNLMSQITMSQLKHEELMRRAAMYHMAEANKEKAIEKKPKSLKTDEAKPIQKEEGSDLQWQANEDERQRKDEISDREFQNKIDKRRKKEEIFWHQYQLEKDERQRLAAQEFDKAASVLLKLAPEMSNDIDSLKFVIRSDRTRGEKNAAIYQFKNKHGSFFSNQPSVVKAILVLVSAAIGAISGALAGIGIGSGIFLFKETPKENAVTHFIAEVERVAPRI